MLKYEAHQNPLKRYVQQIRIVLITELFMSKRRLLLHSHSSVFVYLFVCVVPPPPHPQAGFEEIILSC